MSAASPLFRADRGRVLAALLFALMLIAAFVPSQAGGWAFVDSSADAGWSISLEQSGDENDEQSTLIGNTCIYCLEKIGGPTVNVGSTSTTAIFRIVFVTSAERALLSPLPALPAEPPRA